MRPIWRGAISFGLVNIPIGLYTATRREELKFRFLRASDLSPVNYQDEYRRALERVIEEKIEHPEKPLPAKPRKQQPSNIIDLVSVLEKSIQETGSKTKTKATSKSRGRTKTTRRSRKKAA